MSPRRHLLPAFLAATAAAALLLGGCSIGGGTAVSSPTAPAATSTAPTATGTAGSKVFAEPAACASIAQKFGSISSAVLPVLQGRTGPTPFDADQLSKAVAADTMGTVPAELTPDFEAFTTAAERLRGKDLTAAAAMLHGPEMSNATANIEKFLSDHC